MENECEIAYYVCRHTDKWISRKLLVEHFLYSVCQSFSLFPHRGICVARTTKIQKVNKRKSCELRSDVSIGCAVLQTIARIVAIVCTNSCSCISPILFSSMPKFYPVMTCNSIQHESQWQMIELINERKVYPMTACESPCKIRQARPRHHYGRPITIAFGIIKICATRWNAVNTFSSLSEYNYLWPMAAAINKNEHTDKKEKVSCECASVVNWFSMANCDTAHILSTLYIIPYTHPRGGPILLVLHNFVRYAMVSNTF